ncbi:family 43 glycosylhydrolase [Chitinophaga sedimenti]|uniref:family 43 glycosylhydrolase n=1 Tax=Chitinophaga sedimenti TaxID=2033606 RepID=UPI002004B2D9|nr:family 43 glycosylhydrolase [Chitinophaga sedimenti]MCK7554069.1 family 43 glycosylhydrolase [Chitinophaga sedimenti]
MVWKSKDFVNWTFDGTYFPSAIKELYWAPSKAIFRNGRYYIYPTVNGYMYAAVANKPEGPFRLARGKDEWKKPFSSSTLLQTKDPGGIDAEVFVDDDGQACLFWGQRHAAKLGDDMITVDSTIHVIPTPGKEYSEGPIFFKRKGIYYYLYTIGGDEKYQYAYVMSKVSPLGPFTVPADNIIATTDYRKGIFGPGHGCVFNPKGSDHYYFAFLEFGRAGTNRQTYVNQLQFAPDGTILPVDLSMDGVGALRQVKRRMQLLADTMYASSTAPPLEVKPMKDPLNKRTENFVAQFAADGANGSRWMAATGDEDRWLVADLGEVRKVRGSEVYFVRPTAGHAYILEYSTDAKEWKRCGGQNVPVVRSPQSDRVNIRGRYLRVKILNGTPGIWEWKIY